MTIYAIGFTRTSAEHFSRRPSDARVRKVIDVRLNNMSQLSGFAKRDDLGYCLDTICDIGYEHLQELAPTKEMLDDYKKRGGDWANHARRFNEPIRHRRIDERLQPSSFDGACLLCSEHEPHHCHRRLVAEFLRNRWGDVEIIHL